jgi:hypothetical protein
VGAHEATFQVSNPPKKFPTHVLLTYSIIDTEPSSSEEVMGVKVW